MIRSRAAKLIVNGSFDEMMFFDLADDPTEQKNLIDHPDYQTEIKRHKQELIEKLLFSSTSKTHVDRTALQRMEQSELNRKADELKSFISEKLR